MINLPLRGAAAMLLLLLSLGCSEPSAVSEAEVAEVTTSRDAPAEGSVVRIDAATQSRIELTTQRLQVEALTPELKAYGRLQEDPTLSFVVRAPVAGVIRPPTEGEWPTLGNRLNAVEVVGRVEPRYQPTDQINLTDRLLTARADVRAATAAVAAAEAAYERARILNADNKNISDRAFQEARARLEAEEARLEAAKDVLAVVDSSTGAVDPARFVPLIAERGGEVTEVWALPGEDVAVGAALLRVVSFDQLLANVNLPVGENVSANVRSARIVPLGREELSIPATLVAVNASVDPGVQGQSLLFRLSRNPGRLRPGQAATAYLAIPSESIRTVILPASAVVRHVGESFAYVRISDEEFVRRRLQGLRPTGGGYSVAEGLSAGADVVVKGAQLLLSEELKSQIAVGDDE